MSRAIGYCRAATTKKTFRHQSGMLTVLENGRGACVGDHDARRPALSLQQLAQEPFGGPYVPPALHQNVEHDAVLVHRAPQPVLLAGDFQHDLIEMPCMDAPIRAKRY